MKNVMMTVSRRPKPNMMICLVTCQILTLFKDTDPVRLYVTLFGAVLPIYMESLNFPLKFGLGLAM